jgi:glycosyltransferase involved in cell wall biosynthesis
MRITAILCVHNEESYLEVTLARLTACGIDLAIIDNDSDDRTPGICRKFQRQIVHQARLPYRGVYNQTEQLAAKAKVAQQVESDWFIHHDADEVLESPRAGESLREGIERVSAAGFNVINFDEFVFLPIGEGDDFEGRDFYAGIKHYYFFEPAPRRLMRAWKNRPGVMQAGGGHHVEGPDLRLDPENFILRHYLNLSLDLAKGWHGNRLHVCAETLAFPAPDRLKVLPNAGDKDFDRSEPWKRHYWEKMD